MRCGTWQTPATRRRAAGLAKSASGFVTHCTCCCCVSNVAPRCSSIHPGVVSVCEEAAVAAQLAVLREAGLPAEEVEARVVVTATAHTTVGCGCGLAWVAWPAGGAPCALRRATKGEVCTKTHTATDPWA